MAYIFKDGFIGLLKTPSAYSRRPVVSDITVQVLEYVRNTVFTGTSTAKFDITNLDIDAHSLSYISAVNVEIADYRTASEFLVSNQDMPTSWLALKTVNLSEELKNYDLSLSFLIDGVPAKPEGMYHKFRIQLLSRDGLPAVFRVLPSNAFIKGKFYGRTFMADEDQGWAEDRLQGFSFNVYDGSRYLVSSKPFVCITNGTKDLMFADIGIDLPDLDEAYLCGVSSTYYYVLGEDGFGYKFNGIDDIGEIVGVKELYVEYIYNTWVKGRLPKALKLNKNSVRLKFSNMFMQNGLVDGTLANGEKVTLDSDKFKNVQSYVIFIYISDKNKEPDTFYPANDNKWFMKDEIIAPRISCKDMPYITYTVSDLPYGKYVAFFVGVKGLVSKTLIPAAPPENLVKFNHVYSDDELLPDISLSGNAQATFNGTPIIAE